ncbi:MAG: hypothetical protein RI988_627 [Pseudomonadota bacterium]|jgi:hypothetical protein
MAQPEPTRRGVLRAAAFFTLLGSAALGTDAAVSHGLRRLQGGTFGVWNRIVEGRVGTEIVISGSSRALNHYDPRVLTQATGMSAFNIGLNGSQTDMQLARLRVYLRRNRRPRLLIHNLDLFSLQVSVNEVFDPAQYLPYLDEPDLYRALHRIDADAWKWRLPLYGYAVEDLRFTWAKGVAAALGWRGVEDHADGFLPQRRSWSGEFERWLAQQGSGTLVPVHAEGVRTMQSLLRLCQHRAVPLLLVYSPEYARAQPLALNREAIFARLRALAQQHGATLWDYSDHPLSQDRRWFVNSQHLNAEGAQAFSEDLAKRLAAWPALREGAG